jgi:hypothetical protein
VEKCGTAREVTDNITRRMCWAPKATDTHSEYAIIIEFLRQRWLEKRAPLLRLYLHCILQHVLPQRKFYLLTTLYGITYKIVVLSVSSIYKIAFTRVVGTMEKRIICTPEKLGSRDFGITHVPCSIRGYTCMHYITNTPYNRIYVHALYYQHTVQQVSLVQT